jgi:hypothetical protein
MKTKSVPSQLAVLLAAAVLSTLNLLTAFAQGTAFTYQGRLNDGGNPANGSYVFHFTVVDGPINGNSIGTPIVKSPVDVRNGLFTVNLDFEAGVFTGPARWLSVKVHTNDNLSDFVLLTPPQPILPAPYAIYAAGVNAAGISGSLPAASLAGTYGNPVNLANPGNTFAGNGGGLTDVNAALLGGLAAGNFWQTAGNAGTTAGVNFLGTTDGQPVELRANGQRVLRLDNSGSAPNILGGYAANAIGPGLAGVTIAGGGQASGINLVHSSWGTVSGGSANFIGDRSDSAVVGGGWSNRADGIAATIPGGSNNVASGSTSLAAGNRAQALHDGSFVWSDSQNADFSSTANNQFAVRAQNGVMIEGTTTTLDLRGNGAIRVAGAGLASPGPVFIHRATVANTSGHITTIDNPLANGDPNAILLVTHNYSADTSSTPYEPNIVGVWYNGSRWTIYHEDTSVAMPAGRAFNVMLIKP